MVSQAAKEFDVSGSRMSRGGYARSRTVWMIKSVGGSLIPEVAQDAMDIGLRHINDSPWRLSHALHLNVRTSPTPIFMPFSKLKGQLPRNRLVGNEVQKDGRPITSPIYRLRLCIRELAIINCYFPTPEAADSDIDAFHEDCHPQREVLPPICRG
ncbi:unnamed protein product [Strongylus vulgaris]|uniref:Uncharacterized protein n=1 Tax=Strongylus vulgaris TaxID=40348 RepID=A0A3P7J1P7_STRVU|nr:unnamed protein product [Strongylus vulgaris]